MPPPLRRFAHAARQPGGFTLIELMIVVVIIAVLAAVALPSYQSSVRKARRSDAYDAAVAVQQLQERFRSKGTSYGSTLNALDPTGQLATSKGGYYGLTLAGSSGTGYTLTLASVVGKSQASDTGCTSMTVTVLNGSPTFAPSSCWSQ